MEASNLEKKDQLFRYLGRSKANSYSFQETPDADNPYMLDAINGIGGAFSVYGRIFQVGTLSELKKAAGYSADKKSISNKSAFQHFGTGKGQGRMRMVRASVCEYFVAIVYESSILIHRCGSFFRSSFCGLKKLDSQIEEEIEFSLPEGEYSYLEWSPLNHAYSEKPSFLTLDDKGRLRIHYLKEKTEQMVETGEVFCCATFALGGEYIYAMNEDQELCKIDLQGYNLIMKRSLGIISDSVGVMSSHIKQMTPWMFAIGSVIKAEEDRDLKPYLFLVSGDISDQEQELEIRHFGMPLVEEFDTKKPIIFRTIYLKGRQLLLFGHNGSNKLRLLSFAKNENERKVFLLPLGNRTLRGFIFMKERTPIELQNEYQNKKLELSHCPKLMMMDSEGNIHHYRYFDQKSCVPTLSLFIRPQSTEQFVKRQGRLRGWLERKKNLCKSQDSKIGIASTVQKKKTSKADCSIQYLPSGKYISSYQKEYTIKTLKESQQKISQSLFKSPENPFLSVKTTGEKPAPSSLFAGKPETSGLFSTNLKDKPILNSLFSAKTEDNKPIANSLFSAKGDKSATSGLFSVKTEDKDTTSGLFSAAPSSIKTTGTSLFAFSGKPNFSSNNEPQNSLFGPSSVSTKKQSGSENSNLFSLDNQNKASQTLPDDPIKRKALLFLNKLESDVTFKVEDQEFPAHRAILSEKCRFFKNMFSSGMYESSASVIEISDTKASMFKGFLQYVYLGKATLNEELAMGLFEFSEKYMIDELKESCENCLVYWITLKNCIKIYETADYFEADSLKGKTLLFLEAHIKEITTSKDFEHLPKSTYVFLKRMQWNDKMIFDPSFAQLMNSYRKPGSETSVVKNFLG